MHPVPPILNAYSPSIVYVSALGQSSSDSYQILSIILALVLLLWPNTARTCAVVLAAAVALPSLVYLFQVVLVPFLVVVIFLSACNLSITVSPTGSAEAISLPQLLAALARSPAILGPLESLLRFSVAHLPLTLDERAIFERKIAGLENDIVTTRRELKEVREDLEASEAEVGLVRTVQGATQSELEERNEELEVSRESEGVAVREAKEAKVGAV